MASIGLVNLLREDPGLAQHLEPTPGELANRPAAARVISLPKGEFYPHEVIPGEPGILGTLILDGLVLRGVSVTDRPTVEVLGTRDLIRPFERELDPYAEVSAEVRWWALRPARLAVLDASFIRSMSDHPEMIAELIGRLWRRSGASSLRLAIVQQPCLSTRLHQLLWQLADRFGQVQGDGVLLPVPLCHALLSWLAGARRPAVSRAVNELQRTKAIAHRKDGTWWLARRPQKRIAEPPRPAQRVAA